MNGRSSLHLFKIFGFAVGVDASWIFIALLVTWSLAVGLFPAQFPDLAPSLYWIMGVIGALGLFASIIFHELCHSLVARRYGLPMEGITLFLFGGVAEMREEPADPKTEFLMAGAGPVASIVLGIVFWLLYAWGDGFWPLLLGGVIGYLALINWILAAFNLLPAFPLDGGRMLRAALWYWKRDLRWATRQAARIGSGFGILLMTLGAVSIISGGLVGGIWYIIIGLFLRNAAQMAYHQVVAGEVLGNERVRDRMSSEPVTVPPGITLQDLVDDYFQKYDYKMFPVAEGERLYGCITTREVKEIDRHLWPRKTVGEVVRSCSPERVVTPETEVRQAFLTMRRNGTSRLMVLDGDRLVGVITLRDILRYLSRRTDLKGYGP
ncbi:MAG: site-2 protease family protein [Desulfuromonadales bacterium]|nr:site-2 protease family protein [Desulfuromonadales bacterium]